MDATVHSDPGAGWLSLAAAAEQMGVSRDALRRRIRRGTIPARQVTTRYGPTYEVQLADVTASVADAARQTDGHYAGTTATVTATSLAELTTLVRDLGERSERNAAAAAMWQARAEMLAQQLQQAQLALAAPGEADSFKNTPGSPSDVAAVEPNRRQTKRRRHAPSGRFGGNTSVNRPALNR
jgi:hypothetical protein